MILLTALSLAVAGACGDDADTTEADDDSSQSAAGAPLTKEEFIERGDAICRDLSLATDVVEYPKDETDFARYLKEVRAPTEAAREYWELLVPPTDGAEVHDAVLDALTARVEALNGAMAAAESGDTVTGEDLRAQADAEGNAADAPAQAYGFTECGSKDDDAATEEPADPSQIEEQPADGAETSE